MTKISVGIELEGTYAINFVMENRTVSNIRNYLGVHGILIHYLIDREADVNFPVIKSIFFCTREF
jgi:hypothetical protein